MNIKDCIKRLKSDLEILTEKKTVKHETGLISIPLPMNYKQRYDELQALSDREFGKLLQEIVKKSIDEVN